MLALAPLLVLLPLAGPTTPAKTVEHLKVLVLDVNSTDLTASEKVTLANLEAAHLGENGRLDVLSGEDVKQLVALSGQAQAAGVGVDGKCTDACMAELAGALGAGVVVSTQAGKLGDTLVVTVAVFDAARAKSVARKSVTAQSLGELPEKIGPALDDLVKPLLPEAPVQLASVQPLSSASSAPPPSSSPSTPSSTPSTSTPTPPVQTRVMPAPSTATPPVQTRVVEAPAPPAAPPPAEEPVASTSSDDDLWIILGVTVGAIVVIAGIAFLASEEGGL